MTSNQVVFFLLLLLSTIAFSRNSYSRITSDKYIRKHWKHWTDKDKNCLNVRQELLKSRSLIPVIMNKRGCTVVSGQWQDYYYPEVHSEAGKVDMDHLVPLKHAHDHGGAQWSPQLKEAFANDPDNLVITFKKYNKIKGSKSISQWLPIHRAYACRYMKDFLQVKAKYKLIISQREIEIYQQADCKNIQSLN